jgi:hypothetical protein
MVSSLTSVVSNAQAKDGVTINTSLYDEDMSIRPSLAQSGWSYAPYLYKGSTVSGNTESPGI